MTNGQMSGNQAVFGGGLSSFGSTVSVTGTEIFGNQADFGGGVYASGGEPTFDGVDVYTNTAAIHGGGMYVAAPVGFGFALLDSTVRSNSAADLGGGLYLGTNGTYELVESVVSTNNADWGGGVAFRGGTSQLWLTCDALETQGILANSATSGGGGIYMESESFLFTPTNQNLATCFVDSLDCDFGTLLGGDDNFEDDLLHYEWTYDCITTGTCEWSVAATTYPYDDDETFCTGPGCP